MESQLAGKLGQRTNAILAQYGIKNGEVELVGRSRWWELGICENALKRWVRTGTRQKYVPLLGSVSDRTTLLIVVPWTNQPGKWAHVVRDTKRAADDMLTAAGFPDTVVWVEMIIPENRFKKLSSIVGEPQLVSHTHKGRC